MDLRRLAADLHAAAASWLARSPAEVSKRIRDATPSWRSEASALAAAACAVEGLDEASPLAADHWLAGPYLAGRFLDRAASRLERAGNAPRPHPRRPGKIRLAGLSLVERGFWNLRSAELELDASASPAAPVAREVGAALVVGREGSPWGAVLDGLHHVLVRSRPTLVVLGEEYEAFAAVLERALAGLADVLRVGVAPIAEIEAAAPLFTAVHLLGEAPTMLASNLIDATPAPEVTTRIAGPLPVIITPTLYDGDELEHMARQAALVACRGQHYGVGGSISLIVAHAWAQRDRFADMVAKAMTDGGATGRDVPFLDVRADDPASLLRGALDLLARRGDRPLVTTVVVHPLQLEDAATRARVEASVGALSSPMVGINVWPTSFRALSDAPFACHRVPTDGRPEPAIDFTQNASRSTAVAKVVARAPLKPIPAPRAFSHPQRVAAARALCAHQAAPSVRRAASVTWRALRNT